MLTLLLADVAYMLHPVCLSVCLSVPVSERADTPLCWHAV